MDEIPARVAFKSSKTNFLSLPQSVVTMLYNANINSTNVICELSWKASRRERRFGYCGWSGFASSPGFNSNDSLCEIDPVFALSLELKEGTEVTISLKLNNYNIAKTVELEPLSVADWELVELNAGALENNLLYQTRCIAQDQVIVVYPSNSTSARLKVVKFDPNESKSVGKPLFAKIVNDTEFHIKPIKPKELPQQVPPQRSNSRRTSSNKSRSSRQKSVNVLLRGITLPHDLYDDEEIVNSPSYEVYVNFEETASKLKDLTHVAVSVLKSSKSAPKSSLELSLPLPDDAAEETPLKPAEKVVAKLVNYPNSLEHHVGISSSLATALQIVDTVGNLIILETTTRPLSRKPEKVVVHPFINESEPSSTHKQINLKPDSDVEKKLQEKNELLKNSAQLKQKIIDTGLLTQTSITNHSIISAIDKDLIPNGALIEFANTKDGWVDHLDIGNTEIEIGSSLVRIKAEKTGWDTASSNVVGQDQLVLSMVRKLKRCNTGALIYGSPGSGKTVITQVVIQKLVSLGIHVSVVQCDTLSLEPPMNILKSLEDTLTEISWFSPSVLILENSDLLMPADQENVDNSSSKQIVEFMISRLLNSTMQRRKVGVLFTAKSRDSLQARLFGSHLIEEEFKLRAPDKNLRRVLIEEFISSLQIKVADGEFLGDVALDTEGYLPGDLKVLVDRAHYQLLMDGGEKFEKPHFERTLEGYTPSLLRGVKLQKSTVKWDDIGGLREAKLILLETLEWPTKYAPIFANCPLRLRSGILLYGYPGCGKTLLLSAIASQCGLNFISIKGPEILNKYIGASEQSVRELFDRAQLAKPCILFFDEFDSIAPKRGHDSTGVTDRVVNQMLTQMDGAEGLDGVYVLAATSRPDLIDSALLRPGRLDKSVICDIPDFEDRRDILKCILLKMNLAHDVDVNWIAEQTEGYSGADLQLVGYNAYLLGVHEKLKSDEEMMAKVNQQDVKGIEFFQLQKKLDKLGRASFVDLKPLERIQLVKKLELIFDESHNDVEQTLVNSEADSKIMVTHEQFVQSLEETKASISDKERIKLSNIYHQFLNPTDRDGKMPDGQTSNDIGGRSTLM